jgi:hypothetical protein
MAYSECLSTRLNPLAERTCFSQAAVAAKLKANEGTRQEKAKVSAVMSLAQAYYQVLSRGR